MAMIGRGAAVAQVHGVELHGKAAFAAWLGVHAALMTGGSNRVDAFKSWARRLLRQGARTGGARPERHGSHAVGRGRRGRDGRRPREVRDERGNDFDVIIIGSGAGGGTLAGHLAPSGKKVLIIERGGWLPREIENWDADEVFVKNRYVSADTWYDDKGKGFQPGIHYYVGGQTKFYGAALYRLRREDFGELRHHDGVSPAWPITYDELEPYYTKAEQLYEVHGARGEDPTEPQASAPYPFPAVSHEPRIQQLSDDLARAGYHPFHAPCGVRLLEGDMPNSPCIRCATCDGFPSLVQAKSDAEIFGVRPALEHPNVTLLTNARVDQAHDRRRRDQRHRRRGRGRRRDADLPRRHRRRLGGRRQLGEAPARVGERPPSQRPRQRVGPGRAELHVPQQHGRPRGLEGAEPDEVPEDAGHQRLLLRDEGLPLPDGQHPDGRQVVGADVPGREAAPDQARADLHAWTRSPSTPSTSGSRPRTCGRPENRVTLAKDGSITLSYTPNNQEPKKRLYDQLKSMLGHLGMHPDHLIPRTTYLKNEIPIAGVAHQAGTVRFGTDPATSALDVNCKAHELDNLYVVDTSFFPSIGAVNPALTAIANAIRVGDHLLDRLGVAAADMHEPRGRRFGRTPLTREVRTVLNGKAAIVTGGDSGIGHAISLELARQGASVTINYPQERGRGATRRSRRSRPRAARPRPFRATSRRWPTSSASSTARWRPSGGSTSWSTTPAWRRGRRPSTRPSTSSTS